MARSPVLAHVFNDRPFFQVAGAMYLRPARSLWAPATQRPPPWCSTPAMKPSRTFQTMGKAGGARPWPRQDSRSNPCSRTSPNAGLSSWPRRRRRTNLPAIVISVRCPNPTNGQFPLSRPAFLAVGALNFRIRVRPQAARPPRPAETDPQAKPTICPPPPPPPATPRGAAASRAK